MTSRAPKPWQHKNPIKPGTGNKLTPEQIEQARQRAEAQEKTIKELHKVIADQQNKIEILEARLGRKEGRA